MENEALTSKYDDFNIESLTENERKERQERIAKKYRSTKKQETQPRKHHWPFVTDAELSSD